MGRTKRRSDTFTTVFHTLGSLLKILGALLLSPLIVTLIFGEFSIAPAFLISAAISLIIGFALGRVCKPATSTISRACSSRASLG